MSDQYIKAAYCTRSTDSQCC